MPSAPQALALRAQPRSNSRFQPYASLSQSTTSLIALRSPTSTCLNTSKPSLPKSLPPSFAPHSTNITQLVSGSSLISQIPKDPIQRDLSKHIFALGLIDQAVKSLSDTWRPEDIPTVFRGPKKGQILLVNASQPKSSTASNSHTSSTHPHQILASTGTEMDSTLLPLRNFVHEVLKRSRTSGSVLQTALCYLEAVRTKIPNILHNEKMGISSHFMPESAIQPVADAEMQMDHKDQSNVEERPLMVPSEDSLNTANVSRVAEEIEGGAPNVIVKVPTPTSSPNVALPSPLLCPRRTFLAALILASKFSQDKCYSNRAWAKLSGLPPREIGRCERALGQALDWRLWVGKKSSNSDSSQTVSTATISFTTAPASSSRSVVRSQSESCVVTLPSTRVPFLCPSEPGPSRCVNDAEGNSSQSKGLRRCATAPSESLTLPRSSLSQPVVTGTESSQSGGCSRIYQSTSSLEVSDNNSSSGSSGNSSPITPSPSFSGDRTIQVSSVEDGSFPISYNSSQPWLGIADSRYGPIQSSPPSFLVDAKETSAVGNITGCSDNTTCTAMAMQPDISMAAMSVATESDSLLGLRGMPYAFGVSGPGLWHADAGHNSLEPTRVH